MNRHCHIGKGFLGLNSFRLLVNDSRFARVTKILETPKGPEPREDRRSLAILRSLLSSESRR